MPSHLRDLWTTVDGLRIYARTATGPAPAEARPVVLVHGYGVSGWYLVPTAELLARYYPVYVPDLPGYGESQQPDHALSLAELAETLARWMNAVGISGATLLGNSYGCQIVAELAIRRPGLVERAVLVGPTVEPSRRSVPDLLLRLALDAFREHPRQVLIALRDYWRFGPRRALATFRDMVNDRTEDKLPAMPMPVLVVRGEDDPIVSQEWVERVTALLPRGRLVVVPGAAHAVNFDAPEALADAVLQFLADVPEGA